MIMVQRLFISTMLISFTLTTQACGQSVEAVDEQTVTETVAIVEVPKAPTMTLEEIRAEQEIIEAEIEKIKAKGELERADKIVILKLLDEQIALEKSETKLMRSIVAKQKEQLAYEFSKTRNELKK